ncbi:MAG: poly-beta-1,6-N-acetyl-D-glucosamine N-deacetylase PgaB [Pseudomonadota bacterium]
MLLRVFRRFLLLSLALAGCGLRPAFADTEERFTILSYHEVADAKDALNTDYAVAPTMFVRHIDWLRNNGYHFISIDDLLADEAGRRPLPDKAILLTFDDGYRSMYDHAWPVLRDWKIPSVVAVVGSWEDDNRQVDFDGKIIPRDKLMTWKQLRELSDSGLVEIGSHTFDLHRGIPGNPQGNTQPSAITRRWLGTALGYETEEAYRKRIGDDLARSAADIKKNIGRAPRVIAWPYGRYNRALHEAATRQGMTVGLTLDDGANVQDTPLWRLRRVLVEGTMDLWDLNQQIQIRNANTTDNDRAQKVMQVDLDYIYDPDPVQQEKNLGHLLDRIQFLDVNTVYLQAFADPDGDGTANSVYFPSRHMPMRADLFDRVAWQIRTRTQVRRLYAWLPTLAWDLPANEPAANDRVVTLQNKDGGHVNMGYRRLSPFSARVHATVREIYQDLARHTPVDGVLFHDDATLSDYEDASEPAMAAYRKWGFPASVEKIRADDDLIGRWTIMKINAIDDFDKEMASVMRDELPTLMTARNLYARVVLSPKAEVWYSQALENSLRNYDYTAIMAMPYMEQAPDTDAFYRELVQNVKARPGAMNKVVFELQTVDWAHDNKPVPTTELVATIRELYDLGVRNVGYYPDMLFQNHPDPAPMRAVFATMSDEVPLK